MKKLKLCLILSLFVIFGYFSSNAQSSQATESTMPINIGLYGGLNFNMHSPNFSYYNNNNPITFNSNKNTLAANAGLIFNYPINDMFVLSGRFGYNGLVGKLTGYGSDSAFSLNASLHELEISPMLQVHNLISKDFYLVGGLEFDVPLGKNIKITNDESQQVLKDDNDIGHKFRFAVGLGVGYIYKINKDMFLAPEASFRMPFTQISTYSWFKTWDVPQIRFSVALTFALPHNEPPVVQKEPPSELTVGFKDVNFVDETGKASPAKSLKVEDIQYTELFPIVPYIFCEENKEQPADKYYTLNRTVEAGQFTIESLSPNSIEINKQMLDIIGTRLKKIKNAELTITGTNDNKGEKNTPDLSLKRAEFAKDYLVKYYGINPERINVKVEGLPSKPSTSKLPDGIEENRRIELSSTNSDLLAPIIIDKEYQRIAEPNHIEFYPYATSTDSITFWKLDIYQSDLKMKSFFGSGEIKPLSWFIMPNEMTNKQVPIDYTFTARNSKGISKSAQGSLPVEYLSSSQKKTEDLPDQTISKFSLVLFDFDKTELSPNDMEIIEKNIVPAIKYNSTVKIYGYTDRIGDEEYNRKLALKRAEAVKEELEPKAKSAKFEVYGVGEDTVIFDNDNPIGRQLSRTVQIHVVTPK